MWEQTRGQSHRQEIKQTYSSNKRIQQTYSRKQENLLKPQTNQEDQENLFEVTYRRRQRLPCMEIT